MKIRIKGNSVRYRLTRSEVETFGIKGSVTAQTGFNGKVFTYILQASKDMTNLHADFKDDTITIYLPDAEKNSWPNNERVGYHHNMPLDNGHALYLVVEKDFVCLNETTEDQSDNYPNPDAEIRNG